MCLGIPGRIVALQDVTRKIAMADVGGVQRPVNVACIIGPDNPIEACIGQWVLIHVGFAMARLDERQALETLALLSRMGEAQEQIDAMAGSAAP